VRTELVVLGIALTALPSLAVAQDAGLPKPTPKTAPKTVGEVVVTGQAPAAQTSIDRRSYSVSGDLQAQTGAIADALRNVPSVEVDVQGNVSLRGDPNVTILVDGKPSSLFQGDNKGQALQSLPADSIERVEVITNPSAEFRADGTAGVINLISKKAKGVGRTGSVRLTVGDGPRYAASANLGYNSNRLTVSSDLSVRHDAQKSRLFDDRLQTDPASGAQTAIDQDELTYILVDSANVRVSADYDLTPRMRIGAEAHGNYTDFRVDAPSRFTSDDLNGAPPDAFSRQLSVHQKRAAAEASASLRQKIGAEGEFVLNLSHEEIVDPRVRAGHTFDQAPPAPDAFDEQRLDNHLHHTELKGDYTQPMADMSKLKLGFDIERLDNAYRNRGFAGRAPSSLAPDPALTNLFLFRRTISAAYATYEKPIGGLTVQAGLRVEDVRQDLDQATLGQDVANDYLRAYPTLHLAWKLSESQQFTASYSHRVQRPDPSEFNSFRFLIDPLNFRAGNPHLKPQQTQSFEVGYEYREAPVVLLATLYYRQNRDGVADVLRDLGGGVFLTERSNVAQSRSGGLELVANGRLTKTLTYNLNGNLGWTELESLGPLFAPTRSMVAFSGHGSLTWQATADDLFQLNAFMNGKRLTPQGHADPMVGVDLGYRHKLTDKLSVMMTAQDILGTFRVSQAIDTPVLQERSKTNFNTRSVRVGLTWTFGGGKQRDPGFEFQNGAAPPG